MPPPPLVLPPLPLVLPPPGELTLAWHVDEDDVDGLPPALLLEGAGCTGLKEHHQLLCCVSAHPRGSVPLPAAEPYYLRLAGPYFADRGLLPVFDSNANELHCFERKDGAIQVRRLLLNAQGHAPAACCACLSALSGCVMSGGNGCWRCMRLSPMWPCETV